MEITEDKLLNGRVTIYQPKDGYRVAIDPVLLAAAVPAKSGDTVLDLGIGTGAISLCLQARVNKCQIRGIDTNTTYLELAQKSVSRNGWGPYIDLHFGDVRKPPRALNEGSFDWIVANPPYFNADSYSPSPDEGKSMANASVDTSLEDWVKCAKHFMKPEGGFVLIYPADELKTLREILKSQFLEINLCQILPREGQKAKRVLLMAKNKAKAAENEAQKVVLHDPDGNYTPEARGILWDMKPIAL
jgi:tRNA1(Val) A37 N6-methylase TrmN6